MKLLTHSLYSVSKVKKTKTKIKKPNSGNPAGKVKISGMKACMMSCALGYFSQVTVRVKESLP